ncbi:uncharacterized protein LOC126570276 [Anopheles aquasalis]|uniref:uncharacterized protein LOC126570276 n=1 Tax=Anopheles aquasalis TaxID=42839 RepID=UPI00215B0923|nr:uncharacterized protein LOC126570276 [Anopheles aquasalis]
MTTADAEKCFKTEGSADSSAERQRYRKNEDLVRIFLQRASTYQRRMYKTVIEIFVRYRIKEAVQFIFNTLQKHPFLALVLAIAIFTITLPIVIFIFITMTTAMMAFTGFVLFEGALITAASIMLFSLFIVVFAVGVIILLVSFTCFFGISRFYDYATRFKLNDVHEYLRDM